MNYLMLTIFITIPIVYGSPSKSEDLIDLRAIVEEINGDSENTWKADTYGFKTLNVQEFVKSRLGTKLRKSKVEDFLKQNNAPKNHDEKALDLEKAKLGGINIFLPTSYDARQKYPYCESIRKIRDQSNCGSCWAVSAASVLSDRVCIKSGGLYNVSLSANFVTACSTKNYGCQGGYLDKVWKFFEDEGSITGDDYESDVGCQPYSIRPCGYPKKLACAVPLSLTPKCKGYACSNEWYKSPTETDVYGAENSGPVDDGFLGIFNEYWMRNEIYNNGPIQVAFWVFRDFVAYKSGIYQHKSKFFEWPLGGHAVKIIGWGEELGVKYWLVANSWGEEWGENGLFRIVRGENHCFIEDEAYCGEAVLPEKKEGDKNDDEKGKL